MEFRFKNVKSYHHNIKRGLLILKKVLVITNTIDLTSDYLINKFYDKIQFFRFNTDRFFDYNIEITQNGTIIEYKDKSLAINTSSCHALYYRKITLPDLADYEIKYRYLMQREMLSVIDGIAETTGKIALTRPSILRRADNKIVQLKEAKKAGFNLPQSLITNSDSAASKFCIENKSIIKPVSVGKIVGREEVGIIQTNMVDNNIEIQGLSSSPAYFQSYEAKEYEIRLTILQGQLFGVRIDSTDKVDWRKENAVLHYRKVQIPQEIASKCLTIMKKLNLDFAAFDFIVRDGLYIFLEFNANGQWLWLEEELKLNISESIIEYLNGENHE